MDDLQARHRKELKDLQSRITQKKKQASKKTRKGVNDECDRLEQDLKQRQVDELAALSDGGDGSAVNGGAVVPTEQLEDLTLQVDGDEDGASTKSARSSVPSAAASTEVSTRGEANGISQGGGGGGGKKPNRAKARLARRAAEQDEMVKQAVEEAKYLPDQKTQERDRMLTYMKERGLSEREIRADGHCLYAAMADQLDQLQIPVGCTLDNKPVFGYKAVRAKAAEYITLHGDDFVPFLEEPLESYVRKVRETGEWGGQMELLALAKGYGVEINVLQDFGRVERIEPEKVEEGKSIWLGYYKHGFGLGEHYNSLRKVP